MTHPINSGCFIAGENMKERPIVFPAPMVRAILEGCKTQTRRVIKADYHDIEERDDGSHWPWREDLNRAEDYWYPCPYGQPSDRLWVRENWAAPHAYDHLPPRLIPKSTRIHYLADEKLGGLIFRSFIHMPRWASRITLEVTDVHVERLRDISEADACAEGMGSPMTRDCKVPKFAAFWDQINGRGSWSTNPWVWVVTFKRVIGGNHADQA